MISTMEFIAKENIPRVIRNRIADAFNKRYPELRDVCITHEDFIFFEMTGSLYAIDIGCNDTWRYQNVSDGRDWVRVSEDEISPRDRCRAMIRARHVMRADAEKILGQIKTFIW